MPVGTFRMMSGACDILGDGHRGPRIAARKVFETRALDRKPRAGYRGASLVAVSSILLVVACAPQPRTLTFDRPRYYAHPGKSVARTRPAIKSDHKEALVLKRGGGCAAPDATGLSDVQKSRLFQQFDDWRAGQNPAAESSASCSSDR
jgi:hypothetical protein